MLVINARNVNDAYLRGVEYLKNHGRPYNSRAGQVLVSDTPVTTVYQQPCERVLFDAQRDANPFFHLFEALWMLSGSNDARWLDQFIHNFSSRFSEEDGLQHGAYGFRWRHHFESNQLDAVVRLLKENPEDRRVVLTMWDPLADLAASKKDIPCNTHAYLRIRKGDVDHTGDHTENVLDITVCCRSNDAIWGAYGANAVHFSVLQEYLAARIGVGVGTYYQISNNFHVYTDVLKQVFKEKSFVCDPYVADPLRMQPARLVTVPDKFDRDLDLFMSWTSWKQDWYRLHSCFYYNEWFATTAEPLFRVNATRKEFGSAAALDRLRVYGESIAPDWYFAAEQWLQRRVNKREQVA